MKMYISIYTIYIALYTAHTHLIRSIDGLWSHYFTWKVHHLFTTIPVPLGWCPAREATPPAHQDLFTEKYHWNSRFRGFHWKNHIFYETYITDVPYNYGEKAVGSDVIATQKVPEKHITTWIAFSPLRKTTKLCCNRSCSWKFSEFPLRKRML